MSFPLMLAALGIGALALVLPLAGDGAQPTPESGCCPGRDEPCRPGCCDECPEDCGPGCCDACPPDCCGGETP
jgi:hypothetical protein